MTLHRAFAIGGLALLGLITLVALSPIVVLFFAIGTAALLDCPLDEGSVHPCSLWGVDIGGWLYAGEVLGWLSIPALPIAGLCLVAWSILAILALSRRMGIVSRNRRTNARSDG